MSASADAQLDSIRSPLSAIAYPGVARDPGPWDPVEGHAYVHGSVDSAGSVIRGP
jgi:hypothetical protein